MKLYLVVFLLIILTGCAAVQGLMAGASDELEGDRDSMPGIGAKAESKVGYLVGATAVLAFGLFLGGRRKKA